MRVAVSLQGGSNTGPGRRRKWSLLDVLHRRFVIVNPGEDEFISQLFTFEPLDFRLSSVICSAQFFCKRSVLRRKRKTIVSLIPSLFS